MSERVTALGIHLGLRRSQRFGIPLGGGCFQEFNHDGDAILPA